MHFSPHNIHTLAHLQERCLLVAWLRLGSSALLICILASFCLFLSTAANSAAVMRAKTLFEDKEREAPIPEIQSSGNRGSMFHLDAPSPEKDEQEAGTSIYIIWT